jgi:hypothetical protein
VAAALGVGALAPAISRRTAVPEPAPEPEPEPEPDADPVAR